MTENLKHCIELLQDNEESIKKEAQLILLKLCDHILKYPQEQRYRKLQLSNAVVSNKLLPAAGAIECLFEAGFIEDDDGFLLPINASLEGINKLYNLLRNILQLANKQQTSNDLPNEHELSPSIKKSISTENYVYRKQSFFQQLVNHFQDILRYEDRSLQNKVKSILPFEKLQISAMEKLREIQREIKIKNTQNDTVFEDLLLNELLRWFKFEFFKWVDSPTCTNCTGECSYYQQITSPDPKISRIEIHKCKNCGYENKFPRYTDPEILLYTRKGRCGEWANCFTLICRTLGFDVRLVYDQTDHVWTEVWSAVHNRWIHVDACENVMDQPLMYEKGWGKKLTYVIAFSKDEIQDVTWRYTDNYNEVMKRRKLCSEKALTLLISKLNLKRQSSDKYSNARKKFILKRSAIELAEMITAPPGCKKPLEACEDETNYSGRTSGSLSWKISRGEMCNVSYKTMQWTIPQGISSYECTYSIISDSYTTRDCKNNIILETKQHWYNGIEHLEGKIFRKEEDDWRMVYLARTPESIASKVTWAFVIENNEKMCIDIVNLKATAATFNGAIIKWEVKGIYSDKETKDKSKVISVLNSENFETKDLKGASKISVSATLSGGEGEAAWQHAQLFRQSLDLTPKELTMVIKINLLNKSLL